MEQLEKEYLESLGAIKEGYLFNMLEKERRRL